MRFMKFYTPVVLKLILNIRFMCFILLLSFMLLVATTWKSLNAKHISRYAQLPDFPAFLTCLAFLFPFFRHDGKVEVGWRKTEKVYVVNKRQQSEKRRAGKSIPSKELPNFTFIAIYTAIHAIIWK
jgi:hypothetical protein